MEFLIPSLALILGAVAVAYFILPKLAPQILVISSAVVLAIAIFMHVSQFGVAEYERATWMYNVKQYGAFLIIGLILAGAYGFYAMNNSSSGSYFGFGQSSSPLPAITAPTFGGGFDYVAKTAASRIQQLMRKGRIAE